jgi:hypothetical protein
MLELLSLTTREFDWLQEVVIRRLCELDSYFDLSEEEWLCCEERLLKRGISYLYKVRRGEDVGAESIV